MGLELLMLKLFRVVHPVVSICPSVTFPCVAPSSSPPRSPGPGSEVASWPASQGRRAIIQHSAPLTSATREGEGLRRSGPPSSQLPTVG